MMWNSSKEAEEHYQDLIKVKKNIIDWNKKHGDEVEDYRRESRLETITDLIDIADAERKFVKKNDKNPGIN